MSAPGKACDRWAPRSARSLAHASATLLALQPDALATLVSWHGVNPVMAYEQHRSAAIFGAQGNRNPFIDFPDLAARLDPSLVFTAPLPRPAQAGRCAAGLGHRAGVRGGTHG